MREVCGAESTGQWKKSPSRERSAEHLLGKLRVF